jgi:hypothetical protein
MQPRLDQGSPFTPSDDPSTGGKRERSHTSEDAAAAADDPSGDRSVMEVDS